MRPLADAGTRGAAFWLIVAGSTAGHVVNAGTAPAVARLAQGPLGGDAALAGLLVSLAAIASIAAMPIAGVLADRMGARRVLLAAGLLSAIGLVAVLLAAGAASAPSGSGAVDAPVLALAAGRIVFGAGNAAVATALTAWVVAEAPRRERGRALGLFGLSVWVGLALGPVLGENLEQVAGSSGIWSGAIALQLLGVAAASFARDGRASAHPAATRIRSQRTPFARHLARPGAVGFTAWAAEGFMIAFLIQHLVRQGLDAQGLLGAANVFTVFAGSVIAVRLLLGGLPDRLGPVVTARIALVVLALGLAVLAIADGFALAALGAALIGAGYSPLFPALTLLATGQLPAHRRSAGVGVFSALTSAGYAAGSLLGGLLVAAADETVALLVLAAAQLLVLPLLRRTRGGTAPTTAPEPPPL